MQGYGGHGGIKTGLVLGEVSTSSNVVMHSFTVCPVNTRAVTNLNATLKQCMVRATTKPCFFINYEAGNSINVIRINQTIVEQ